MRCVVALFLALAIGAAPVAACRHAAIAVDCVSSQTGENRHGSGYDLTGLGISIETGVVYFDGDLAVTIAPVLIEAIQ